MYCYLLIILSRKETPLYFLTSIGSEEIGTSKQVKTEKGTVVWDYQNLKVLPTFFI